MDNKLLLPVALFVSCAFVTCTFHNQKKTENKPDTSPPSSLSITVPTTISVSDTKPSESLKTAETSSKAPDCNDCSLANSAPKVDRHLLICGEFEDVDWPKKIEKEKDTFACALAKALTEAAVTLSGADTPLFNVKMTACNEPNTLPNHHDIIVYPEKMRYSVPKDDLECLAAFATYISHPVLPTSTDFDTDTDLLPSEVIRSPRALPWETLLLVCTHGSRDKRCGRAGPILIAALQAELASRDLSISSKIAVRASSHIGGHRYAGTLIVYPQGQWYGFMTKKNAKPLLDSILGGGILDKCFRGLGNISW